MAHTKCPACGAQLVHAIGARVHYYADSWAGGYRVCTVVTVAEDGRYTLAQSFPAYGTEAGYLFRDVRAHEVEAA
jgi:rRNA maturation protein Nop10